MGISSTPTLIICTFICVLSCPATSAKLRTKGVVRVQSWIPSWKNDCVSHVALTSTVPNLQVCQQLLESCSNCCITGYDVKTRACHVLTAEPRNVMTSGGGLKHCSDSCGPPRLPRSVWVDCGSPSTPNGAVSTPNGTTYPNSALFTCDTGYNIVGNSFISCQSNGSWSDAPPTCQIENCGSPDDPTNGSATSTETTYGGYATFTCNTGYRLAGEASSVTSKQATCLATGNWSRTIACEAVTCSTLNSISNGWIELSQGNQYNSIATYKCNEGYQLTGNDVTRTCRSSSTWSGSPPNCNLGYCPSISVNNGTRVYIDGPLFPNNDQTLGGTVQVTCNDGHYLSSGDNIRTCLGNFTWSGSSAVCSYRCYSHDNYVQGVCLTHVDPGGDITWNEGETMCTALSWTYAKIDTEEKAEKAAARIDVRSCGHKGWIGLSKHWLGSSALFHVWRDGTLYVTQHGWGKQLDSSKNSCINIKKDKKFEEKDCTTEPRKCALCHYSPTPLQGK